MSDAKPPKAVPAKNARGQRQSHAARLRTKPTNAAQKGGARDRVLHAALECFGAFGFEGTSTRAVAERAGLSHPLLLYHFASKEQLWRSTMEAVIDDYRQALELGLSKAAADDVAAGLRAFIDNFVRFSARTPQLYRIMTQESTQGSERIHWLIDTHLRPSFERVVGMITTAQATGLVRGGDPARLYYAIIGLAGSLLSVSSEFELLTGRNVFAEQEIDETIVYIDDFVFKRVI